MMAYFPDEKQLMAFISGKNKVFEKDKPQYYPLSNEANARILDLVANYLPDFYEDPKSIISNDAPEFRHTLVEIAGLDPITVPDIIFNSGASDVSDRYQSYPKPKVVAFYNFLREFSLLAESLTGVYFDDVPLENADRQIKTNY